MTLRLVLGDQLNRKVSSLRDADPDQDVILMAEVRTEATYVKHHKKKIVFVFSAMRHFAQKLRAAGFDVRYTTYDDPENQGSLLAEVKRALAETRQPDLCVTEAGEYRLFDQMKGWEKELSQPVEIRPDDRFLCSKEGFARWASDRKQLRMEYFYREMRKEHDILIADGQPVGGQWNYDAENRKPPKNGLDIPKPFTVIPDRTTREVMTLVAAHFPDHFGDIDPFHYGVTRDDALAALDLFISQRLSNFGDYQDAMIQGEAWMYHSHIALYLNCGLLAPLECIQAAERAYHSGSAPLNAVEGFVRQILGWREYVRGLYWLKMPDYKDMNALGAERKLPEFYWTGETQMNCLRQCVLETKENAYAHHIQRLMVLGNFALVAGLAPDAVNDWYLLVYADAYEWVELPNVSGMVLFADGGILGSKPYAASGAYINRMSNYCASCRYKVTKKNGPDACPFNYLYWDFLDRNADTLRSNPRMGLIYKSLARMEDDKRDAVRADAARFLRALDADEKV